MPLQPTGANDAGLLEVIASIRQGCDLLAARIADHSGQHNGEHGLGDCQAGALSAATVLQGIGACASANASELLDTFCTLAGMYDDGDNEGS